MVLDFLLLALLCKLQGEENAFTNTHFNEEKKVAFKEI